MSLINNLLKDLEKRQNAPREVPFTTLVYLNKEKFISIRSKKFLSLFGFAFLILLLISAQIIFRKSSTKLIAPKTSLSTTLQPAMAAIDPTWLKPTTITGVTLQVKDNITEVTFMLDHASLYRLISDDSLNQLSIIIDHSQLQSELPPVNYLHTAIEKMSSQVIQTDTKFILSFTPGSTIKYVNLNQTATNAELVVAIETPPTAAVLELKKSAPNQAVKAPAMQNLLIEQYQTALLTAESGNYQSAIDHLSSLLKIDPGYKDARVSLIALLLDQGQALKAKEFIDQGINEAPDYVPFIELKARVLATEGKYKQALSLLQTASPSIDENPEYHAFIAAMYEQNNYHALAATLYKQLLSINANNGSWWFGLGVSLDKLGKNKDAVQAYTHAASEGHLNRDTFAYLQTRLRKLQETTSND